MLIYIVQGSDGMAQHIEHVQHIAAPVEQVDMSNTMSSSVRYMHVMASIHCNDGNVIHTCRHQQLAAVWISPEKVPSFKAPQRYIVIIVSE